jgi:hypothetical protein
MESNPRQVAEISLNFCSRASTSVPTVAQKRISSKTSLEKPFMCMVAGRHTSKNRAAEFDSPRIL